MHRPSVPSLGGSSEKTLAALEKSSAQQTLGLNISRTSLDLLPTPVVHNPSIHRNRKSTLRRIWGRLNHVGAVGPQSTSSVVPDSVGDSHYFSSCTEVANDDKDVVDEVVVDRVWSERNSYSVCSDGQIPDGVSIKQGATRSTDKPNVKVLPGGFWTSYRPLAILRWKVLPAVTDFFCYRFVDEKLEKHYQQEMWFGSKRVRNIFILHIFGAHDYPPCTSRLCGPPFF